jgi:hypothetical protein
MKPITLEEATAAMAVVTGGEAAVSIELLEPPRAGHLRLTVAMESGVGLRAAVKEIQADTGHHPWWRAEADVYESGVLVSLVDGLRAPLLYGVVDLGGEGVRIWIEDVVTTDLEWTNDRTIEAARLLGRMTRRFLGIETDPPLPEGAGGSSNFPRSLGHGNPWRGNLLAEGASPDRFVLVDWETAAWWPVGFDLAPLIWNPVEQGMVSASEATDAELEIISAYCEAGFEPSAVEAVYREATSVDKPRQ